jgi:hypothetical protein
MTRLGILTKYLLIALVSCATALYGSMKSSAQDLRLDSLIDAATPNPIKPTTYACTKGTVKEISKKQITIIRSSGHELTFNLANRIYTEEGQPGKQQHPIKTTNIHLADIAVGDKVFISFEKPLKASEAHRAVGILVVR